MAHRLRKIDEHVIKDHTYLNAQDECHYISEYAAGQGYQYSGINNLILNLKKTPDRKHKPEWRHKIEAMNRAAQVYRELIGPETFQVVTLVPIPPSKAKSDPLYDNRLTAILETACQGVPSDIRELIVARQSLQASHLSDYRLPPHELQANFLLDENLCDPIPQIVLLFDDMITTGAHFRACKNLLVERFPGLRVVGTFIARRAIDQLDP